MIASSVENVAHYWEYFFLQSGIEFQSYAKFTEYVLTQYQPSTLKGVFFYSYYYSYYIFTHGTASEINKQIWKLSKMSAVFTTLPLHYGPVDQNHNYLLYCINALQ